MLSVITVLCGVVCFAANVVNVNCVWSVSEYGVYSLVCGVNDEWWICNNKCVVCSIQVAWYHSVAIKNNNDIMAKW